MARKSADMILLLGSRGQYRGRKSGFFQSRFLKSLGGTVGALFGRAESRSSLRSPRGGSSAPRRAGGLLLLAVALVGFVGGFFVRGHFAAAATGADSGAAGLHAAPQSPGLVGETDAGPLAPQAFIVSVYPNLPAAEARQRASALADWLREQDLKRARPYEWPTANGPLWVVAVYFDGDTDQAATAERLHALPAEVPDATFVQLRKSEAGWPNVYPIR